jgi:hypothetical protein
LAITIDAADEPRRRRRSRWVVDSGTASPGRAEIYALVVAGGVLALVLMALLRLTWLESTGGVKLGE